MMEDQEGNGMRKNKLAVFQHVNQNDKPSKRRTKARLNSDDSTHSELVIDEDVKPVKRKKQILLVKLSEEPLNLKCNWTSCTESFNSWSSFNTHLIHHVDDFPGELECHWNSCDVEIESYPLFIQHMSNHAYLSKLKNIGDNVAAREKLPKCRESHTCVLPLLQYGYLCEWKYCNSNFSTIYEFLDHLNVHIKNNPKVANKNEIIECCWNDCNTKYSTQHKLADHLKSHTKEKIIGCSSCNRLFSNKTKFCDHRKRQKTQLSLALQTYQCSQCLKLFPTERLLRDHIRSHVNHYKCTMCDMTCSKPSVLAKHIRFKHINFKPYECPECKKRFVEKFNLNTHIKIHIEENPLKCFLCEFECRTKVTMDNHYVNFHDAQGAVYECHCCKKRFKRGTYLTKHLTKHHDYRWPSGHSRFRYRKDEDEIYRLQTVRYESLEVTQDLIRSSSESMQDNIIKETTGYNLRYSNSSSGCVFHITNNNEPETEKVETEIVRTENVETETADTENVENNILISINDVDDDGNILKSEVMESKIVSMNEVSSLDNVVPIRNNITNESDVEMVEAEPKNKEDKDGLKFHTILGYKFFKKS